jgi:cytochrome c oxidase subunit 3
MHQIVRAESVHATHEDHQEHHWESSWAPMAIAFGVLLLVPAAFALKFIYQQPLAAIIVAGIGTPLVLAGIAKWIHEGATQHAAISNVSPVGVGVFIIGEILIFLGLFASYWTLRLSASVQGAPWPPAGTPHLNLVRPLVRTAILVASRRTYHIAEERLDHGRKGSSCAAQFSIALGAAFLGCTAFEYTHLFERALSPAPTSSRRRSTR